MSFYNSIHPSIHPSIFYTPLIHRAGAYPSGHWARGGVHPGQVASPSQGHTETNETNNHTRSHSLLRTFLESQINLTCMFLNGGRKREYPEGTHTYMGRKCKLAFIIMQFWFFLDEINHSSSLKGKQHRRI